jgi:SAM-dependent methyltransferase
MGILLNNIADRLSIRIRAGIDISQENIKVAKDLYPVCTFIYGTIDDYTRVMPVEMPNHRFDLIILSDIIEHLPDDLAFMKRVSGISNYVLLNLPLEKCFRNRNRQYGETHSSGHLRSYDKALAIRLVNQAGFEVVSSETAVAFSDKLFFEMHKRNRTSRIRSKPLPLRLFWTLYYVVEDQIRLSDNKISEKIYGTNYFALLKSKNL